MRKILLAIVAAGLAGHRDRLLHSDVFGRSGPPCAAIDLHVRRSALDSSTNGNASGSSTSRAT